MIYFSHGTAGHSAMLRRTERRNFVSVSVWGFATAQMGFNGARLKWKRTYYDANRERSKLFSFLCVSRQQ